MLRVEWAWQTEGSATLSAHTCESCLPGGQYEQSATGFLSHCLFYPEAVLSYVLYMSEGNNSCNNNSNSNKQQVVFSSNNLKTQAPLLLPLPATFIAGIKLQLEMQVKMRMKSLLPDWQKNCGRCFGTTLQLPIKVYGMAWQGMKQQHATCAPPAAAAAAAS